MVDQKGPYKIATLVDLRDAAGRHLLLHRRKPPNRDLYSPIGGKLDVECGESPARCAQREVQEETGLDLPLSRFHLVGVISENDYEGAGHWLMFFFCVEGAVELEEQEFDEGRLEWHEAAAMEKLPIPATDRHVIWPLVYAHEPSGFFAAHIDGRAPERGQLLQSMGAEAFAGKALPLDIGAASEAVT